MSTFEPKMSRGRGQGQEDFEVTYSEHFERHLNQNDLQFSEVKITRRSQELGDDLGGESKPVRAVTSITRRIRDEVTGFERRIVERAFREDAKIVFKTTESDLNEDERKDFWRDWHEVNWDEPYYELTTTEDDTVQIQGHFLEAAEDCDCDQIEDRRKKWGHLMMD